MISAAQIVLDQLLEGNDRFRKGQGKGFKYSPEDLLRIAKEQHPIAGIIACSDSRVTPEVIFDQPLGTLFASRVPGNVASESAKWMLDLAVGEFKAPLVVVLGHTGCLAVGQLLDGDHGGAGGLHRFSVLSAVYRAKAKEPKDLYLAAVEENVLQTVQHLSRDLPTLALALKEHSTSIVGAVYHMESGEVRMLPPSDEVL
jgi:carbonic anhydrase